jgi:hypothetical protein
MQNRGPRLLGAVLVACALIAACVGEDAATTPPDAQPPDAATADGGGTDAATDTAIPTDAADAGPPSTCGNKVKDGDETDLDCGGSCGPCPVGKACLATNDCASGLCSTVCTPWQRTLPGTNNERGMSAAVDALGNVYVTGDFFVDLNLGPNTFTKLTSAGSCDAFVAKLDPSGTLLWSKRYGGTDCDQGLGITVDAQGDPYVVGASLSASIDLGTAGGPKAHVSSTNSDLFVLRLSTADGATKWATTFGAGTLAQEFGIPRSYGIAVDSASNVWVTANATAATDYGAGLLTPAGADDALILRLGAAAGGLVSAKLYGGTASDAAQAVVADAQGVYVTGYFGPSIDFGLGTMNAVGGHDAFVVAFDVTGATRWQRNLGGNNPARPFGSDRGHAIHTDAAGNVYVGGLHSGGPMDLGGGVTAADPAGGISDAFAASYKSDGTPRWALAFGGNMVDAIYGIRADNVGNVIVAGYTQSATLDVGSGPVTHGLATNAFLSVLSDANGVPKRGRFLGRTGTSVPSFLTLRPKTSSLYLIGTFDGSLQSLGTLGTADAGAPDLAASASSDGFVSSLGNVP